LEIEFHRGGTYQYSYVPPGEYERLMRTNSKGRYLWNNIRTLYPYRKVSPWEPGDPPPNGNPGDAEARRRLERFLPEQTGPDIGKGRIVPGGKAAWSFLQDTDDIDPATGR